MVQESQGSQQFGEVYQQIQAKFGERPDKPREIKKSLGKDDFLHIMITQMKNQDPMSPFKAEQMATQVAQFTTVEQLHNMNQNLTKLSNQNKPMEQLAMTNMIGKTVTIDRQRFPHMEGQNDSLSYNLPKDAKAVKVVLISETGEIVLQKDMGPQKAGDVAFTWDGIKSNSLPAKQGNYMLRIEAEDENGAAIQTNSQAKARVIGVSFEGQEPVLLVGDARRQEKVTMKNIIRVESQDGSPSTSGKKEEGIVSLKKDSSPNFFTFQKGVGSVPLNNVDVENLMQMRKETSAPAVAANSDAAPKANDVERGFPNGLNGGGE